MAKVNERAAGGLEVAAEEVPVWYALERMLLYMMVFSLPIQAIALVPGTTITITKAAGLVLMVSVLLRHLLRRRQFRLPWNVGVAVGAFGLACALSVRGSIDRTASLNALHTLVVYAVTFLAVVQVAASREAQVWVPRLYPAAAAVSGVLALAALAGLVAPTEEQWIAGMNVRRVCVGAHDSNDQALLFLFALAFLFFARPEAPSRAWGFARFAAGTAVVLGLALTMSRTGWILALGLAAAYAWTARNKRRYLCAMLGGAVLVSGALAVFHPTLLTDIRQRAVGGLEIGDRSIGSRLIHLSTARLSAMEGGAFGHGLHTTLQLTEGFRDPFGEPIRTTVHNVPLIIWLETGWVGLMCLGFLWSAVIALFLLAMRDPRLSGARLGPLGAYVALLAVYAVVSLVMPFIYRSAYPILLGCALGALPPALLSGDRLPPR